MFSVARFILGALILTATSAGASPRTTFQVRGVVCSSLRGPRLFVIDGYGTDRRLRFKSRRECMEARHRLRPVLDRVHQAGGLVFVTPIFDARGRIADIGAPEFAVD